MTAQNNHLEENTLQAARATSQLNTQLADALTKILELEADLKTRERDVEKLEEEVASLQVESPSYGP